MPGYRIPLRTVGAAPFYLSAASVKEYADFVDTEYQSVNADIHRAATLLGSAWDLRTGTAWQDLYSAWGKHLEHIHEWADSLLSFGPGQEWNLTENYEKQVKDWQARIADMTKIAPSGNQIDVPVYENPLALSGSTAVVAGAVAVAVLGVAFLLRK